MTPDSTDLVARYNEHYEHGCELLRGRIFLDKSPKATWLSPWDRWQLRRAIRHFKAAREIAPRQWQCDFWIGKALQRIGDLPGSLAAFERARVLVPDNSTVAKETAIAALDTDNPGLAVALLRPAVASTPDDASLHHNLAIALLFLGLHEEALLHVEAASELDPHSSTTRLGKVIRDALLGGKRGPSNIRELQGGA